MSSPSENIPTGGKYGKQESLRHNETMIEIKNPSALKHFDLCQFKNQQSCEICNAMLKEEENDEESC